MLALLLALLSAGGVRAVPPEPVIPHRYSGLAPY